MTRKLILLPFVAMVLAACANEADQAQRRAVQDRELQVPIDVCIRHASGEAGLSKELLAANFVAAGESIFRRSFTDLDNALTTQGSVTVTLAQDCEIALPIHVIALQPLGDRLASQLSARGYRLAESTDAGVFGSNASVYTNGQNALAVSGFARNEALRGFISYVRFEPR